MTAMVLVIFKTDASDLQIYLLSFSAMACLVLALEFVNGCDQAFILVATKLRIETMTAGRGRISMSNFTWLLVRDQVKMS